MAQAASLWVKLGLSDKDFADGLKRAENQLKRFGDRLSSLGSRLTVGLSVPLGLASMGAIKLAANLEQTKIAFEVMTGSAEKASRMVESLQKMGAKTPYESGDLLESAKTLMLFGVEAEKVEGMLQMLGDVASGSSDKLKSLSLAFAQVQSTGRLTGQDLLQMINAGFNPLQIISEKTGVSMAKLKEKMSEGGISAQAVTNAFRAATSEGGRFFGMMDKQSQTTLGKFSTFIDNAKLALTNLGTALLPFANKLMDMLIPLTEQLGELADWFLTLPAPVQNLTVAMTAFGVALGPVTFGLGKMFETFSALPGLVRTLTTDLPKLATAFGPFLAGGAIVAGLLIMVDFFSRMAENARIAKLEISQINTLMDAQKKKSALEKQIEQYENMKKAATPSKSKAARSGWVAGGIGGWSKEDQAQLDKLNADLEATNKLIDKLSKPASGGNTTIKIDLPKIDFSEITTEQPIIEESKLKANIELVDEWSEQVQNIVDDTAFGMNQSLSGGFFDIVKGDFDSLGDYIQNFFNSVLRSMTDMMAQMTSQKIMGSGLSKWITNLFGGGPNFQYADTPLIPNFGGFAANGGTVEYGKSYIVGEKGPELFTPSSSGTITPNNALGGANVTVQVVNPPGIPLKAKTTQPKFDGKQYIIGVVLEEFNNNPGFRNALGVG
jgi:tape measure domain-containing protein